MKHIYDTPKFKQMYEVWHYTVMNGWVNTWHERFATREEAESELQEHLAATGHDPEEYMVMQVDVKI